MDHVPSYGKALCAIAKGPPAPPFSVWEPARPPPSLKTRAVMLRLPDNRAIPAHFLSDAGRKGAPIALKTLADYYRFYNDLNQINGSNQTTNLGVRSSNLFGRANHLLVIACLSPYCARSHPFRFAVGLQILFAVSSRNSQSPVRQARWFSPSSVPECDPPS